MKPNELHEGEQAPDFSLPDKNGKQHQLSDFAGGWVLLYFYPRDDTPGCTKEACTLRDNYTEFEKNKIQIIGISVDSEKSHEQFITKYHLPFLLLSDTEKKVVQQYGVWGKKIIGLSLPMTKRTSFLLNPQGIISKIYTAVTPSEHAEEILKDYKNLPKK